MKEMVLESFLTQYGCIRFHRIFFSVKVDKLNRNKYDLLSVFIAHRDGDDLFPRFVELILLFCYRFE